MWRPKVNGCHSVVFFNVSVNPNWLARLAGLQAREILFLLPNSEFVSVYHHPDLYMGARDCPLVSKTSVLHGEGIWKHLPSSWTHLQHVWTLTFWLGLEIDCTEKTGPKTFFCDIWGWILTGWSTYPLYSHPWGHPSPPHTFYHLWGSLSFFYFYFFRFLEAVQRNLEERIKSNFHVWPLLIAFCSSWQIFI